MLDRSDNLNYCFLIVVISDLNLFQEILFLNPCFINFKYLILPLIDKVTTGTQSLVLVIIKLKPVMWSSSSINTHLLDHSKSSSTSRFIKIK